MSALRSVVCEEASIYLVKPDSVCSVPAILQVLLALCTCTCIFTVVVVVPCIFFAVPVVVYLLNLYLCCFDVMFLRF